MKLKPANVTQINADTYRFTETAFGEAVYMYLLVGGEKALLVDTGYGFTNVPAAIQKITPLPLLVVNTHGHVDHVHGNHLYNEVYLSEKDADTFRRHTDHDYLLSLARQLMQQNHLPTWLIELPFVHGYVEKVATAYPSRHRSLPPEMRFELGGRTVRILETPGHTAGSVCLLDEKNGWLFSGDNNCAPGVMLNFPESVSVAEYSAGIKMLCGLADEGKIKQLFPAHQTTPLEPETLITYQAACDEFLHLSIEKQREAQTAGKYVYQRLTLTLGTNSVTNK